MHYGKKQFGYIHISKISGEYIENIYDLFSEGDNLEAKIIEYNKKYSKWALTLMDLPQMEQSVKKVVEENNAEILGNHSNILEFRKDIDEVEEVVVDSVCVDLMSRYIVCLNKPMSNIKMRKVLLM